MITIKKISITLVCFLSSFINNAQIITTIAGNGSFGFSGDGGQAINAEIAAKGIAADAAGNIFIADAGNSRIRKVSTNGIISTIAGIGVNGFGGDGGAATAAIINNPVNVAADAIGNIYIADQDNQRIRKIDNNGIITTIAGNGNIGFSGDGGQATAAALNIPIDVATDAAGNIYFIDQANLRIRKIATNGIISSIAGNGGMGFSGDGGQATAAQLNSPTGLSIDATGNIYFTDQGNQRVRKINTAGIISTVAGNGTPGFSGDGGQAMTAQLNAPIDVAVNNAGEIFIADQNNHRIRKVDGNGIITTLTGDGSPAFSGDGGPATAAEVNNPYGITVDADGNIFVGDAFNYRVRKITAAIIPLITISTSTPLPICKGVAVQFKATTINAGSAPVYQWRKNSTNTGTNSPFYADNTLTAADTISCVLIIATGESAVSNILQITLDTLPVPNLTQFTTLCQGDSLVLNPGIFDSYTWQDGSTGSKLTVKNQGTYSVTVTNTCGSNSTQTNITEIVCNIAFPNAFTPNNDGINDLFRLKNPPVLSRFRLSVYNRWGENIFTTTDPAKGWDGSNKGKAAVIGTYIWTCEYSRAGYKKAFQTKGSILLLR